MIRSCCLAGFLVLALGSGCQRDAPPDSAVATPPPSANATSGVPHGSTPTNTGPGVPVWPPVQAQPRLETIKLFIGTEVVTAEVALTREQVGTGMMFRKTMPENEGMLFVFGVPHRSAFYMKNTTVPLTAAYLDSEGAILELHDLQPLNETAVEADTDRVQFVLEMSQGWFARHHVAPGAVITSQSGALRDTFRFGPP